MKRSARAAARHSSGNRDRFKRRANSVEPLESRVLLSGTWSTVDSLPLASSSDGVLAMAADSAGNVYAIGSYNGASVLREKPSGSGTFANVPVNSSYIGAVFADAGGNLFLNTSNTSGAPTVLERAAGQTNFSPVNVVIPSNTQFWGFTGPQTFAGDSAGDVFAIGNVRAATGYSRQYGTIYTYYGTVWEMAAGKSSFSPVHSAKGFDPSAITLIDSGPSAGIYVIDDYSLWQVDKSIDGGASWTVVDGYNYDSNDPFDTYAWALASDSSGNGNVYVVGDGEQKVISGYKTVKVKGQWVQQPVYTYRDHWLTRRSSDGGLTWTNVDDFQLAPTGATVNGSNSPNAVADLGGTLYVAGVGSDSSGNGHAIVRANVGGIWQTADDYDYVAPNVAFSSYSAVTIDPTNGTPYAGTGYPWMIRSGSAAASSSSAPLAASTSFSSTVITMSDTASSDSSTSWLKRRLTVREQ